MVKISDEGLVARLRELAGAERALLGEVLRLLREVEDRKLPEKTENPTLYSFCVKELGYSEHEAYSRIQVTRLMKAVPEVVNVIEAGSIGMTVASSAQQCFRRSEKNKQPVSAGMQREIITSLCGCSTREAEKRLAELFPEQPARQHSRFTGNGNVRVAFSINEDLFEDVQELFRIRSHTNPEKRWEKLLADLVKLGWQKWHPSSRGKRSPRARNEAPGHQSNQQDQAH